MNCDKPLEVLHISQYPIDTLESLPDYLLAVRTVTSEDTGATKYSLTRIPSARLFPQGNMDNVVALEPNNEGLEVPKNQVRAGYVQNTGNVAVMQYADASHTPTFLMLGKVTDLMLVQNSGFVHIPEGHEYIINQTYYVSANGVPTTDSSSGKKLFVPVSRTKLAILL